MSDSKICRICVRKDVKMYEHDRYQLQIYYKEITGSKISNKDCLQKWFCFECAALLNKFHEFRTKCYHGQKLFKKLLDTGFTNTNKINSTTTQPHLQMLSTSRTNVKTYTVKHKETKITHNNRIHCKKKKYKAFTEVFIDVKTDTEINLEKVETEDTNKCTDLENLIDKEVCSPNDNQLVIDESEFDDVYDDENEYNHEKIEFKSDNFKTNQEYDRNSVLGQAESTLDKTDSGIEIADSGIDKIYSGLEKTNSTEIPKSIEGKTDSIRERIDAIDKDNVEKSIFEHNSQTDEEINPKTNLDNKFQRSVKKKFLDENHWTKITLSDEEASRRFQAKATEQKYLNADYKCTDCYRTFSQEEMMKRHIKLRHCESLGPNECRHCRMRFKWKSRLQKHLKEHYTIFKCLRCELSFPVEISAFQHDYSHNGVTWTCAHCGQGFRHSSTYYTHLRKHKSKHVCNLCGVSFVSEFGLFMHKRVKHVITEDCKDEGDTYCKVCDIKFDTRKGFEEHFAESALHATEMSDGASLPLKTRCTKRRVPRISTNCAICGKTYSTYASFTKHHLSQHPGSALPRAKAECKEQRQICEVCGVTLASAWSLVNHLNTHTRDKRYTCKTCGMQLSSRSVLQRHQLTHSQEKSFVCDTCDKRFTHRAGLRLHLRAHDNEDTLRSRKKPPDPQNVMDYIKNYGSLAINYR